jgi:hypothetical protein
MKITIIRDESYNPPLVTKLVEDSEGTVYERTGWYGCQFASTEFWRPGIGECRYITGRQFIPYSCDIVFKKCIPYYRITWSVTGCTDMGRLDEAIKKIDEDLDGCST